MADGRVALYFGMMGVLLVAASGAGAASIDTLSSWTGGTFTDGFGEQGDSSGAVTFGQTFRISAGDAQLKSVTFVTEGKTPSPASQVCTFETCVMAWDGSRPTGPALFVSEPLATSSGFYPVDTFTVLLGDTAVTGGTEYVVLFTANNFMDGIRSDAMLASTADDSYTDGMFMAHYGGTSFADLSAWGWYGNMGDVAFRLDYEIVPEPATLFLLSLGGLVLRRRERA